MSDDRQSESAPAADSPQVELSWLQVICSTFAAGMGIQSRANRERDFEKGSAGRFVVAGLVLTALLVATLFVIVRMALP